MPTFRFYIIDGSKHRAVPVDLELNDAGEAIDAAATMQRLGCSVEVWAGSRLVQYLEPGQLKKVSSEPGWPMQEVINLQADVRHK